MKRKNTLRKLFNLQGGVCAYCGIDMDIDRCNTPDAATIDHIFPKSKYKDLASDEFNMVCVCRQCNNEKADMPLAVFIGLKLAKRKSKSGLKLCA